MKDKDWLKELEVGDAVGVYTHAGHRYTTSVADVYDNTIITEDDIEFHNGSGMSERGFSRSLDKPTEEEIRAQNHINHVKNVRSLITTSFTTEQLDLIKDLIINIGKEEE